MRTHARSLPLDAIDLEHLTQTLASRGYEMIRQAVEQDIEAAHQQLLSIEATEPELRALQGEIRGLEKALRRPQELKKKLISEQRKNQ